MDLDDALVTIWLAGLEQIEDVDQAIPARVLPVARRALGLRAVREMRLVAYWERELGLDRRELADKYQITLSPGARVLPKGALRRLRRTLRDDSDSSAVGSTTSATLVRTASPEPQFAWKVVGRNQRHANLTVDEVIWIHESLEEEFAAAADPIQPPGVRDMDLLESAVYRAETSLGGEYKYPTAEMSAAALMHSIVQNHAFFNGNKRTAVVCLLVALDRNGVLLTCSESELFRLVLRSAKHSLVNPSWSQLADRELLKIADWICQHCRPIQRGDRLLTWRELRPVLSKFGCTFEGPLPGNKIRVKRTVETKTKLGRRRKDTLGLTVGYASDGREVPLDTIKNLRQMLQLDDAHGYDAGYFYDKRAREPDEFIAQHRNLLRRLAKV